jgi:hypothetical protein
MIHPDILTAPQSHIPHGKGVKALMYGIFQYAQ